MSAHFLPMAERLASKSALGGPDGTCLEWTDYVDPQGYGHIRVGKKIKLAHRVAWEEVRGVIAGGLVIDHMCRNRRCVEVDHLRLVTPRVNALENSLGIAAANVRKTHCIKGHEFSPENTQSEAAPTGIHPDKRVRRCAACHRAQSRAYYQRNRAKEIA